jgi:hypothetical protein
MIVSKKRIPVGILFFIEHTCYFKWNILFSKVKLDYIYFTFNLVISSITFTSNTLA